MWSLTLREEQRLRVLENRVLMKISGPKREVMHNVELYNLYASPNIVRVIESKWMR
jgi:hypothetical protein